MFSSKKTFGFGAGDLKSIGQVFIAITLPGKSAPLVVDIGPGSYPLLIVLDVMDAFLLYPDTCTNKLVQKPSGGGRVKCRRIVGHGHLFFYWQPRAEQVCFTTPELRKLHLHFYHPKAERLLALLRRA